MSDDHYLKHQKLIYERAWRRIAQNPNLDFQELLSEGNLAYCEALQTHDPAKGRFSTHLVWRLRHRLGKANARAIDLDNHTMPLDEAMEIPDPSCSLESSSFQAGVEGLGAEAREVINLILGSAGEFANFTCSSVKATRGHIRDYLRNLKWPGRKIDTVFNEIKGMLKAL
jgi:hypothetical protein